MDIFTTQLTRVVPVTVKPEKLKVKGLVKDAKPRKLDQEMDHDDGHELCTITQQYAQDHYQQEHDTKENIEPEQEKNIKTTDDPDEPKHHLDIFV